MNEESGMQHYRVIRPADLKQLIALTDFQWQGSPFEAPQMRVIVWQGYADSDVTAWLAARESALLKEA
jgi:hypothetical protein